jgi:HAD superfamily hydrolase (TIGR01509 family)
MINITKNQILNDSGEKLGIKMACMNEIYRLLDSVDYVIFDCDGVIVDSEPLKYWAYYHTFMDRYQVSLSPDDVSWRGKPEVEVMNYWLAELNIEGEREVKALIAYKRQAYSDLLAKVSVALIPGIIKFLNTLIAKGKRLGLATACRRDDQQAIFKMHHLDKYFKAVITLDDVRFPKPDPEIYLKTAARLNTKPENCLVFEDSPSGVRAAKTAGVKQVICLLTSYQESDFKGCSYFLNNYEEL